MRIPQQHSQHAEQETCHHSQRSQPQRKNKMMPTKPYTLSLLYMCGLIIQAGYIHTNPGPTPDPSPNIHVAPAAMRYMITTMPYSVINVTVSYHTACVQINDTTLEQLKYRSVLWFCSCCGLPNYSVYLFTSNINTPNPNSVLESLPHSSDYTNISDDTNPTFAPNPANTSTPDRAKITSKPKLLINCIQPSRALTKYPYGRQQ